MRAALERLARRARSALRGAVSCALLALAVLFLVGCALGLAAAAICYLGFDAAWRRA